MCSIEVLGNDKLRNTTKTLYRWFEYQERKKQNKGPGRQEL